MAWETFQVQIDKPHFEQKTQSFKQLLTCPIFNVGTVVIKDIDITAGTDVAFVAALMRCAGMEKNGERIELEFRLTIGLRKIDGQWMVLHEHHSIPAS